MSNFCMFGLTFSGLCPSSQSADDDVSIVPLLSRFLVLHNFTFITAMYLWKRGRGRAGGRAELLSGEKNEEGVGRGN